MDSIIFSVAAQKAAMLKKQVKLLTSADSDTIQKNLDSAVAKVNLDYFAKHDMTDEIARVAVLIDTPQTDIDIRVEKLVEQRKRDKDYKSEEGMLRVVLDKAMENIIVPQLNLKDDEAKLAVIKHQVRQAIKADLPAGFVKAKIEKPVVSDPLVAEAATKAVEFVKVSMTPDAEITPIVKPYAELIVSYQAEAKVKSSEAIAAKLAAGDLDAAEKALAETEKLAIAAASKTEADRIASVKAEIEADIAEIKKRLKNIHRNLKKLPEADKTVFNVMLSDLFGGYVFSPVLDVEDEISDVPTTTVAA
ncbi:hypothetical protein FACS189483_06700 [Spirochaetia bacterium]|nr:hypothetical protein FACS189483_06700 [Spirochaetia bacterium]